MSLIIYYLRREKISFFTRKGLSVPELPTDFMLPEADPIEEEEEDYDDEDNAAETAIAINTALVASSIRNKNLSENHNGGSANSRRQHATQNAANKSIITATTNTEQNETVTTLENTKEDIVANHNISENVNDDQKERFDYVIDRTYGVEV